MPPLYRILEIVLYSLLNFLPYLMLALYPFRQKLRFKMPLTCVLVAVVTLVQIGLGVWAGLFAGSHISIVSAVSTLVYLLFYFIAVKAHIGKTVFTLLMLSNIANLVVVASKCIEGMLFPDYALQSYRWTFSLVMIGVELVLLVPLLFYIRNTYTAAFEKDSAKAVWRYLWLIPATFYIVWYYHLYSSTLSSLEMYLQPANTLFMLLINMGAMLIYHMVILLINTMDDNITLTEHNLALTMKELQYANLQERIAEARQAKHDIRHHISVMSSYLQRQEYGKLEEYLSSYKKSLPDDSTIVFCENHAVNILLLYFAQQAKNHGIDFAVHAAVPEALNIPANDLSVLLGNLLENAVDACAAQIEGDRRIVIKAKTDSTALFLTVDNTFSGELRRDKQGNYLSTKQHGSGLGLTSARSIVSRCGGRLDIAQKEGMFCVSVMLDIQK